MSMYIRINVTDSTWQPGLRLFKKNPQMNDKVLGQFAHFIAEIYKRMIVDVIENQRYKGKWAPLSPRYAQWKKDHGLDTRIWVASGLLKDSIAVYRSNDAWVVGINPKKVYPGTQTRVLDVCRHLEFGTSRMPARPLFRPVRNYISKNTKLS